nr:hypothetical protein HK105_003158 [Polyrhizophydium stewartii]
MPRVPVLGRLSLEGYVRLIFAFVILITEPLLRFVFAVLPLRSVADMVRRRLTWEPPAKARPSGINQRAERVFLNLSTTEDFARGFPFEPHYVTTKDGYILALHRIPGSRAEHEEQSAALKQRARRAGLGGAGVGRRRSSGIDSGADAASPAARGNKPVALLWHGFLMCSEVWVCTPDPTGSLAFTLADAGYDVWMGNTRGNKYSCKHQRLRPTDTEFWDFSIDQLALCDLPDAVEYILRVTGAPSLSYIGFSQGTAQGFSALSLSPNLNRQINLFIALAPATKPRGLENRTIHSLINASPEAIYLLFGRRSLLSSALFWQSILTPTTFAWVIDTACYFLFGWKAEFMDYKKIVYRHLYSYSAVKIVVHWFQIMKSGRFQMYDDQPPMMPNAVEGYHVPRFPTSQIQTPVAIFYGGRDSLPDMRYIIHNMPAPTFLLRINEFEHLHFLWGRATDKILFPGILGLLAEHTETWSDAPLIESDESDRASVLLSPRGGGSVTFAGAAPAMAPTASSTSVGTSGRRTVPWITQGEIDRIMELGRAVTFDDKTGNPTSYGSSISVAAVIDAMGGPSAAPSPRNGKAPTPLLREIESEGPGIAISHRRAVKSTDLGLDDDDDDDDDADVEDVLDDESDAEPPSAVPVTNI